MPPLRHARFVVASFTVIVVLTVLGWRALAPEKGSRYLTATVERGDLEHAVLAMGTLQALKQVDVGAQVSGQLKSLKVKLGDKVKKDQWLAEIDPMISQNALRQAEANVDNLLAQKRATTAQLAQAELTFRRQQQMLHADSTSRQDYDVASTTLDVQRATLAALDAQIRAARIEIETAQVNLGYTRIVAPIDAEVVAIVTQEGQTVIAQEQAPVILTLADLDTMTVKAQVSEADVIRVLPGQTAYFTILGDPDTRHCGKLRATEPAPQHFLDARSASGGASSGGSKPNAAVFYNALFDVPNPDHRLRISMTAQVGVLLDSAHDALVIPAAALGTKSPDGRYAVSVLGADEVPVARQVLVGINNNVKVEVLDGLRDGERVVIGDTADLSDERDADSDTRDTESGAGA